jgi:hypothetical protein
MIDVSEAGWLLSPVHEAERPRLPIIALESRTSSHFRFELE